MIWELTYRIFVDKLGYWKKNIFTSPLEVIETFKKLNSNNFVLENIIFSLQRLILGFVIALVSWHTV